MKRKQADMSQRILHTGAALTGAALLGGCALFASDAEVYRRADQDRVEYLEREIEVLRADLEQAEEAMIAIESGMRDTHTRADAVSAVAEARLAVEKGCNRAPWRTASCDRARAKLDEAEQQVREGRLGTAVFFASRARRIGDDALSEGSRVARSDATLFVRSSRVNLRAGPSVDSKVLTVLGGATPVFEERRDGEWVLVRTHSGLVGWIYGSLLRAR